MSGVKLRIATLLASNIAPAQIARAVNCSESYISDLQNKDEQFMAAVQELKAQHIEKEVVVDQQYEDLEQTTLTQMTALVGTADMRELSLVLKAVNDRSLRVGRSGQAGAGHSGVAATVPIALPIYMAQSINIKTNERNEIVEVEGKSMISLSPAQLTTELQTRGKSHTEADVIDTASLERAELLGNLQATARPDGASERSDGTTTARQAISQKLAEIAQMGRGELNMAPAVG